MNIKKHKWGDDDLSCVRFDFNSIDLWYSNGSGEISELFIDKQDAIAIAKHFNQDRESLVLKIKELIDHRPSFHTRYGWDMVDKIQKLIEGE